MATTFREMVSGLKDELDRTYGVKNVVIEPGGKHPKLCFNYAGKRHELPIPASPSDHRTQLNQRAQLRRLLGEPATNEAPRVGLTVVNRPKARQYFIRFAITHEALVHLYGHEIPGEVRLAIIPQNGSPWGALIIKERGERGYKLTLNPGPGDSRKTTRDRGWVGHVNVPMSKFVGLRSTVSSSKISIKATQEPGGKLFVPFPAEWRRSPEIPTEYEARKNALEAREATRVPEQNEKPVGNEPLLKNAEIAAELGITPAGLSYRVNKELFPRPDAENPMRWYRSTVDAWLKSHEGKRFLAIHDGKKGPHPERAATVLPETAESSRDTDAVSELRAALELLNDLLAQNPDVSPKIRGGRVVLVRRVEVEI